MIAAVTTTALEMAAIRNQHGHISLIAAIDEQYGLGKKNQLLTYLPKDQKHFRTITRAAHYHGTKDN